MYLSRSDVKALVLALHERFPGSHFIFDTFFTSFHALRGVLAATLCVVVEAAKLQSGKVAK